MKSSTRVLLVVFALACAAGVVWLVAGSSGSPTAAPEPAMRPRVHGASQEARVRPREMREEVGAAEDPRGAAEATPAPEPPRTAAEDRHIESVRRNREPSDRWRSACEHLETFSDSPHRDEARKIAGDAIESREDKSWRKLVDILSFSAAPQREGEVDSAIQRLSGLCRDATKGQPPLPRMTAACRKFYEWRGGLNEKKTFQVIVEKATARKENSDLVDCGFPLCEAPDLFARIEACGETFVTDIAEDSYETTWEKEVEIPWGQSCQDIQVSLCDDEPRGADCVHRTLKGRYPIVSLDATFSFEEGSAKLVVRCDECTPKKFMTAAYKAAELPKDPCAAGATLP